MRKKIIISFLLVIVATSAAFFAWRWENVKQGGDESIAIVTYGNVDIRQVDLGFRVSGKLSRLLVEEGDSVRQGDLLAVLDGKPYEDDIALQEAELETARSNHNLLKSGYRTQEIEVARSAVAERRVKLKNLETELVRRKALLKDGVVAQQTYDDIRTQRDEAQARLKSAQKQLSMQVEGYRGEEIKKAYHQVESKMAQVEIARTHLEDTRLVAPSDGTVLVRVLEPGSIAGVGQTVITLSLSDPVWVRAYIAESSLGKIHPGMTAEVYTDTRPGQPYSGHIGFISPQAEFTPKNIETEELRTRLVYRFRVIVDNPDNGLRQGMPVTVHLAPERSKGADSRKDKEKRQ